MADRNDRRLQVLRRLSSELNLAYILSSKAITHRVLCVSLLIAICTQVGKQLEAGLFTDSNEGRDSGAVPEQLIGGIVRIGCPADVPPSGTAVINSALGGRPPELIIRGRLASRMQLMELQKDKTLE
jgi:hypothetical protein